MAEPGTYTFLTLVTPPEKLSTDELALRLAALGLSDPPTLRQHLARVPPLILAQCDPLLAERAVLQILELGGDALTISMADIQRLGGTMRIKDITIHEGALELHLWRGPTAKIPTSRIDALVLAHTTTETRHAPSQIGRQRAAVIAIRPGSALRQIHDEIESQPPETKLTSTNQLDIHTTDGSVFQIDGDKFGFKVLGDMRTQGDQHNMRKLFELLQHLAPQAAADTHFGTFKPPSGIKRLRLPNMTINNENPAFAFYSRWITLVYRHITRT